MLGIESGCGAAVLRLRSSTESVGSVTSLLVNTGSFAGECPRNCMSLRMRTLTPCLPKPSDCRIFAVSIFPSASK